MVRPWNRTLSRQLDALRLALEALEQAEADDAQDRDGRP